MFCCLKVCLTSCPDENISCEKKVWLGDWLTDWLTDRKTISRDASASKKLNVPGFSNQHMQWKSDMERAYAAFKHKIEVHILGACEHIWKSDDSIRRALLSLKNHISEIYFSENRDYISKREKALLLFLKLISFQTLSSAIMYLKASK